MPDPLLYLAAVGAAAGTGAAVVLALRWLRVGSQRSETGPNRWLAVLGIAAGLAAGYYVLQLRVSCPPANGLDRLLTIVLPAALGIELAAAIPKVPPWLAWSLRLALVAALGRILLHDSVYLSGGMRGWTFWESAALLVAGAALSSTLWGLLAWLAERSPPGISIPLALAMTIASAGAAILLAGTLSVGAASLPLAAALVGTAVAMRLAMHQSNGQAAIGIGVIGLSGLLILGQYFGGLSSGVALVLLLAPLLCWATELPPFRRCRPWIVGSLRLSLVAVPLILVLGLAKLDFDRETAPLLTVRLGTRLRVG